MPSSGCCATPSSKRTSPISNTSPGGRKTSSRLGSAAQTRESAALPYRQASEPMTATPLHVLILAAGEGKRMKSASAKVLMPLAGRPLAHVIEAARSLDPAGVHVVYGHNGQQVRDAFATDTALRWIEQRERLG